MRCQARAWPDPTMIRRDGQRRGTARRAGAWVVARRECERRRRGNVAVAEQRQAGRRQLGLPRQRGGLGALQDDASIAGLMITTDAVVPRRRRTMSRPCATAAWAAWISEAVQSRLRGLKASEPWARASGPFVFSTPALAGPGTIWRIRKHGVFVVPTPYQRDRNRSRLSGGLRLRGRPATDALSR